MFKIIRSKCCVWMFIRLDLARIGIADSSSRVDYKQARFSSFSKGLKQLSECLPSTIALKSAWNRPVSIGSLSLTSLETTCDVTLAHPKYTKPQKGNKTDRKDAMWICDLFMCGMIKRSFIPPADIRELYELIRYRTKLTNMITGEKNRALNCSTVSNLKLDDVFTDVFGKSSSSIIRFMLDNPGVYFDVTPSIHGRCKTPVEEIQAAVDGAMSPAHAVKLRECMSHIDQLESSQAYGRAGCITSLRSLR